MHVQVSKLERVLKEERAAREQQVSELEGYTAQLEAELEAEQKRRLNEQLRALIEGAPFVMYKSSEIQERHVWFRYQLVQSLAIKPSCAIACHNLYL